MREKLELALKLATLNPPKPPPKKKVVHSTGTQSSNRKKKEKRKDQSSNAELLKSPRPKHRKVFSLAETLKRLRHEAKARELELQLRRIRKKNKEFGEPIDGVLRPEGTRPTKSGYVTGIASGQTRKVGSRRAPN